jgi:hypothetical protein
VGIDLGNRTSELCMLDAQCGVAERLRVATRFALKEFLGELPDSGSRALAEPDAPFQETDRIIEPRLPRRRLIFGRRSGRIVSLFYEKGGRGVVNHLW